MPTVAEMRYLESVPSALRGLVKELKEMNEHLSAIEKKLGGDEDADEPKE
jgi:hypothetical protein